MLLHNKLIQSFPSNFEAHIKIEILEIEDVSKVKEIETIEQHLNVNEYVALIEEKIDSLNCTPKIIINYPFGEPVILDSGEKTLTYEKVNIYITFMEKR